jgi:signal transduction histidine kinase
MLLAIVMLCFVVLSAVFISKLAIEPLMEYVSTLQNLSKETLHELNLPISTIVSNATMLKKSAVDDRSLKRIRRIESACDMLTQRYNELDYLIRTQSEQNVSKEFSLDELILERVEFLKTIYPHIEFNLSLTKKEIFNDKIGLSKVVDNIIDNAVKYSNESREIKIVLEDTLLTIEDFGCGMDEVELLHIFDRYYQSDRTTKGFGIGLSMVKRFCDKNKIDLSFHSQPNKGTKVSLKFKEK